ncbi:ty3-gypsy retrotransposon protein [Cucumis melo var. makuwa]|uniref:Ty3-gypsy retrotransposon protein n=1 Tax=Cucumis melo var. makuwa TaxID=1194695 RepID=A0A5D3DZ95_CUCMM|nr:ty3-gypsy retrotransposon protein [Cucumis melo var. makuwa]
MKTPTIRALRRLPSICSRRLPLSSSLPPPAASPFSSRVPDADKTPRGAAFCHRRRRKEKGVNRAANRKPSRELIQVEPSREPSRAEPNTSKPSRAPCLLSHLSLPSSTSGHSIKELTFKFSGSAAGLFGDSFPFLGVDSIEGHNRELGKGFPTTGPRIEAGNVVTRPLVVACVPSGVRNSVRIGTDAGCSVRGSLLSGFWLWSLVVEGRTRLICASFESTRLICASFESTRLICASLGITRLIGVSFGITRLICAFYGTTRLLCRVKAQRGADRREAGRMREGHRDASGFLYASADVFC